MELTPLEIKLLTAYIRGELPSTDQQTLEKLISDEDKGKKYRDYLKERGYQSRKVRTNKKQLFSPALNTKVIGSNWFLFGGIATFVMFGLLFIAQNAIFFPVEKDIFTSYYEGFPNIISPIKRGDVPSFTDSAFYWYETAQFEKSQNAFGHRYAVSNNSDFGFYQAISAIECQNYDTALAILTDLPDANYHLITLARDWYKALLMIKCGDINSALPVLQALATEENIYRHQANQLLINLSK